MGTGSKSCIGAPSSTPFFLWVNAVPLLALAALVGKVRRHPGTRSSPVDGGGLQRPPMGHRPAGRQGAGAVSLPESCANRLTGGLQLGANRGPEVASELMLAAPARSMRLPLREPSRTCTDMAGPSPTPVSQKSPPASLRGVSTLPVAARGRNGAEAGHALAPSPGGVGSVN